MNVEGRTHPGRRKLERYAFTSSDDVVVSPDDKAHFETCDQCKAAIDTLLAERQAFNEERPPAVFAAEVSARASQRRILSVVSLPRVLIPVALAAVLALVIVPILYTQMNTRETMGGLENEISLKGEGGITLYVRRNGTAAIPHVVDEPLRENDAIKFEVTSGRGGFVSIVNIDSKGRVSIYLSPNENLTIAADERRLLPGAIVLDDFVGRELIVAIVSKKKLNDESIKVALRKAYESASGALAEISTIPLDGEVLLYPISKKAR